MINRTRRLAIGLVAGALMAGTVGACGGSAPVSTGSGGTSSGGDSSSSTGSSSHSRGAYAPGGTLQVLMGSAPDSLDPDYGNTTQAAEADWVVYTPLLTYKHADGTAGTVLIPGLAQSLPALSDRGKTYTMTIRKGLKFSNGTPLVASDFTYGIERSLRINWGGDSFFTNNIVGATAYLNKTSKTISGISTNEKTGQIVIHLLAPYGSFANVLAFPAAIPLPPSTPMTPESNDPPPGIGPYEFTGIKAGVNFTLAKNPSFAGFKIPNIPTGYVNHIDVTIQTNPQTEAGDVLDNQADEFDWADTLPGSLLSQIEAQKDRYQAEPYAAVQFFFLNVRTAPFNNLKAREAVNLAISRVALDRLDSGQLTPACYFLPPGIPGHVSGDCSFGSPTSSGSAADVAKAKQLVQQAGLAGSPVTVWTMNKTPRAEYGTYLQGVLNAIGFKATVKTVAAAVYWQTVGSAKTNAQIGYCDWNNEYPDPGNFYLNVDARAISPINNDNLGNTDDPHIQSTIISLEQQQMTPEVASQWQALERYVQQKYYMAVFGYPTEPLFVSDRVDFAKVVFEPLFGDDWTSFELKS